MTFQHSKLITSNSTKFLIGQTIENVESVREGNDYEFDAYSIKDKAKLECLVKENTLNNAITKIGFPKEKIYKVSFYDTNDVYYFDKDSEVVMRNGENKKVQYLKEGDLCMTFSKITPLNKIGVVKYVVEEEPTEDYYNIDFLKEINIPIAIPLSNGVLVRCN